MKIKLASLVFGAVVGVSAATAASAATLDDVKARGELLCGVSTGLAGFAAKDDDGNWGGLDVDVCKAVAAAALGDASKVKYVPTTAKERFTALQSGEVDMLSRVTTWTFSRDVKLGFEFVGVNYYDGQGFMVKKSLGVTSALQLDGATVCVQTGTTTELNLADYFRTNNMGYKAVNVETPDESQENYVNNACDVWTTDSSALAAQRGGLADPTAHIILPEIISKEPLGPLVRHGDNQWGDVVRWSLNAMVIAEEKGVTKANVDDMKGSSDPEIKRLLGTDGDMGSQLGLSADWAYQIVKQVGNYGESFEAHVGVNTPIGLERGLNQLWNHKNRGILYSPPMR
jgi:general L-amino acid transport system substrate-binding protein